MRRAATPIGRRLHPLDNFQATTHSSPVTGFLIATFAISENHLTVSKSKTSQFSNRNKKRISVLSRLRQTRVAEPLKSCRMREEISGRVRWVLEKTP